jgi:hypothetical protein
MIQPLIETAYSHPQGRAHNSVAANLAQRKESLASFAGNHIPYLALIPLSDLRSFEG